VLKKSNSSLIKTIRRFRTLVNSKSLLVKSNQRRTLPCTHSSCIPTIELKKYLALIYIRNNKMQIIKATKSQERFVMKAIEIVNVHI
jgi:hypothetical protein